MPGALTMLPVSGNCPARARAATVSRRPVAAKVASRHISQHRHARGCEASTSGLDTPCGLEPLHSIHTASLVAALWAVECLPSLAAEADMVAYNSTGQSESITNIVGFFYIGLVCYFFYKVFTRRAKKFTSERIRGSSASSGEDAPEAAAAAVFEDPELAQPVQVAPWETFLGAAQAAVIGYGLWIFSTKVDAAMDATVLPDQYTARNISITVKTIIRGISYLATFVFAANAIGLAALTVKLLLFGDDEAVPAATKPLARGPSIRLDSDVEDVIAAFDLASKPRARDQDQQR